MALHAGEVNYDEHGVTAASINLAFRLLDSDPLKAALAGSSGVLAVRLYAHCAGQRPVDPAEALTTLLLTTGVAAQRIPPGLEARSASWRGHLARHAGGLGGTAPAGRLPGSAARAPGRDGYRRGNSRSYRGVPGQPPRHDPGRRRISDHRPSEGPWDRRRRGSNRLALRSPGAHRGPVCTANDPAVPAGRLMRAGSGRKRNPSASAATRYARTSTERLPVDTG